MMNIFLLGGGKLKYNSVVVKKCVVGDLELYYVSNPELDSSSPDFPYDEAVDKNNGFVWSLIVIPYKRESNDLDSINIYKLSALRYFKDQVNVPYFFGFDNKATYPLKETYFK